MPTSLQLFTYVPLAFVTLSAIGCVSTSDERAVDLKPLADAGALSDGGDLGQNFSGCGLDRIRYAVEVGSDDNRVSARVLLKEAGFRQGSNDFAVALCVEADADAELVGVHAFMPAHGHAARALTIEANTAGYCVGQLPLTMAGRWEVTLTIRAGSETERVVIPVDVR